MSPLIYLAARITVRVNKLTFMTRWLALCVLGLVWLALYIASVYPVPVGNDSFRIDEVSGLLMAIVLTVTSAATVFSFADVRGAPGEEKYYAALIMMTGSMLGLVCSVDLFNVWVWFELLTISTYSLVMFRRDRSLEAGLKYLVQSAAGSTFILFGIALFLMQTGTLSLQDIARTTTDDGMMLVTGALLITGFGVKIAIFPLHTWLPDAHSQAPSGISAVLSGIVIEVALLTLLRVLAALGSTSVSWGMLLLCFGALNMLGGNLLALRQTQVKRLLAYSSIAQVGYMLLGFGIAIEAGQAAAAQGAFFHVISHGLGKVLAFLVAGALLYALSRHTLTISELSGASRRYPLISFAFSLALLSLASLPPFAGFMSKWQIFAAGFRSNDAFISVFVIFGALTSVISLAYYLPLINFMYRQEMSAGVRNGRPLPLAMAAPVIVLALAIVLLGLFPNVVSEWTSRAGETFVAWFGG
jgi:proton-translocating NADH-quinone oxidoreductase chain N